MNEIIIDKNAKQITFTNNGIGFSQFGIADEVLDLIESQIKEIKRLKRRLEEYQEYVEINHKEIERLNNVINELSKENQELKEKTKLFHKNRVFSLEYDKETLRDMVLEYQEKIDKAIEYINEYAWQEDIIGDMWTTTGEPVKDRYMRLEWDNCNELLEILKGEDKE